MNKEPHWIRYIKKRIAANKNFIAIVTGGTGSGKSFSCLRIAEMLDSDFSIRQCVFKGIELMRLVNGGTLKKGSVIVWEEVGVNLSSRSWQGTVNKMLNYLLQTFRHKNFILLMNSPVFDFLDSGSRKLLHAEFRTSGINLRTEKVALRCVSLQYNSRMGKFYYHKLKVRNADGGYSKVGRWLVAKPVSVQLLEEYKQKKESFTGRLNVEILEELEKLEEKGGVVSRALTEKQAELVALLREGLTLPQIAERKGRAVCVVRSMLELVRKKGYRVEDVRENGRIIRYNVSESGREGGLSILKAGSGGIKLSLEHDTG